MISRWRKKTNIDLVTAGKVQFECCLEMWAMLYLCRSCGLAVEWSQRDSCSGLLSLNHDMCYHSHHCSLHRSLQGNKHSQSDKPHRKIHHRCRLGLLISPHWNSIHAYWWDSKKNWGPTTIFSTLFVSSRKQKWEAKQMFRSSVVDRNEEETRIESRVINAAAEWD